MNAHIIERRAASQDDMREAIRLQALANEMRDIFEDLPIPADLRWNLSLAHSILEQRAARLMERGQ